jgi:hypothetical protein
MGYQMHLPALVRQPGALVGRHRLGTIERVKINGVTTRGKKRYEMGDGHLVGAGHGQRRPRIGDCYGKSPFRRRNVHGTG